MVIRLESYSNKSCYLFSKLFCNDEYVCDTLEFANFASLKNEEYYIRIEKNYITGNNEIIIFDYLACNISSFVEDNNEFYKNIKMRVKNNKIQVGLESQGSTLNMCSYTFELLLRKISKAINYNEKINLVVNRNNIKIENE